MPSNTNLPENERSDSDETFWRGLLASKTAILLLGVGGLIILCNVLVFFVDIRPNAWLYRFDMHYWSLYFSAFMWIAAIWGASELLSVMEFCRPIIRIFAGTAIIVVMSFALLNSFSAPSPDLHEYTVWFNVLIIAAAFCAARSLSLLHTYLYEDEGDVDPEETVWFWGMSGFLWAVLIVIGMMHIIPARTQLHEGITTPLSLFTACQYELEILIKTGHGSLGMRTLAFIVSILPFAFLFIAGKWAMIFLSRFRET